ncbi:MAG: hypothetical protein DYG98_27880, partial [Haliscomenobacteraceae bacterium CHB4]|nr:hypothetical protein [Haliscomenobacteraceae bacterium CHB4]
MIMKNYIYQTLMHSKAGLQFYILLCLMLGGNVAWGQVTVFSDDFSTNTSATYTTSGAIGASAWSILRSGDDWGGRRNTSPAQLELTNDVGATANAGGWVLASTPSSSFSAPYNTTLSSNTGIVTWTFNMRQIRTDPSGFGAANYGMAFILAGSSTTNNNTGNGYAVVLGQSGSTDPVRLARYSGGIQGTMTDIITSNTTGLTDFGAEYLSVKVTYTASTNTWELFLRNDGGAAFSDPESGSLTSQGTAVDNTHTGAVLALMGAWWQGSTTASQTAFFDNTKVTVCNPGTANAGADQTTCINGVVQIAGVVGGSANAGTWDDGGVGGFFSPSANSLSAYYTPPFGNVNPITLTLTPNGPCPTSDALIVTYSTLPPVVLTAVGPADASCGENIVVIIEATSGFNDISSYQYSVNFDETKLMYVSHTVPNIGGAPPGVGTFNVVNGEITSVWFDPSGTTGEDLPDGTAILTITFKVLSMPGMVSVDITGTPTPIEFTNSQFCVMDVTLNNDADITLDPVPVTCPSDQTVCSNAAAFALTGGAPAGGTYSGPGVTGGNTFDPATANIGANVITYTYTAPDGCIGTCTFTITVNEVVTVNAGGPYGPICEGDDVSLNGSVSGGASTGTWDDGGAGGTFSPNANTLTATYTPPANFNGTITLTLTSVDPDGPCSAGSNAVMLSVNAVPVCSVTGAASVCANSTGNVYSAPAASSFSWSISGNGAINGASNAQNVTVDAGAAGSFTLTLVVTDANNCSSTCDKTVTVNALPSCNITGDATVCANSNGNVFSAPAASSYAWSISGNGTINGAANAQNVTVDAGAAGNFTLTLVVTDANGCSSSCNEVVTVDDDPLCGPPDPDAQCTPPATFDYDVVATGTVNWTTLLPAVTPSNVTQKIRITGTGTVNVENSDLLLKSATAVLVVDGPTLQVRKGNFKLETAGSSAIFNNAVLRVSGNTQLTGSIAVMPQTSLCMFNCTVEIGDEIADGYFSSDNTSSSSDFQNDGGYRYLQYVCINITHDLQLSSSGNGTASGGGLDVFINVFAEIGDRGANHASATAFGTYDNEDSGSLTNNNTMLMYNSDFVLANGNIQNQSSSTMVASDASFKINNGNFQNSGTLTGQSICLGADDEIQQNSGSWQAGSVTTWYAGGSVSGAVPFPPPVESAAADIAACISSATCSPCVVATADAGTVSPVCINEDASLSGSIGGSATLGTWDDGGAGGTFTPDANTLNAVYTPPLNFTGNITLTLTTDDPPGICGPASDAVILTVYALPAVTCPGNQSVCENELPLDLTTLGAMPAGGAFS